MMRRRIPLLVALVLLALGALLASLAEGPTSVKPRVEPEFPRWPRPEEMQRARERRTLPPIPAPAAAGDAEPPRPRDPFLVALPRDPSRGLVVLEANAIRHSRLGELFVECAIRKGNGRNPFEEMREELGIDPLKDLDRVAFSEDGIVLSGFFDRARLDRFREDARETRRGSQGRIFTPLRPSPDEEGLVLGLWRDQLLVFGTAPFVEASLDRMEAPEPEAPAVIPEDLAYGEAYGVVPGRALRGLFDGLQWELGHRIAEAASRIELHADAMRDLALVANVSGADAATVDDLGKALGVALAVARVQALSGERDELAELLEHARVVRGGDGGFSIEVALPAELVEKWFEGCGKDRGP